jgi:putative cell wall-binding protein
MRKMPITSLVALTAALTLTTALTLVAPAGAQAAATTFTRLAGADRYATAVAISQSAFQPQFTGEQFAVTVASGANFPDALAAGPVAAKFGGPLILVPSDGVLPATVTTELTRLNPFMINIAGGAAAVSSLVESQLKDFGTGSTVFRWNGVNRYDTAAQLASLTGGLSTTVFLATGASFPDALGGSAAAGRLSGALLLTEGNAVPDETASALTSGKPVKVVILGGEAVISAAVISQVHTLLPGATVERWAGADRYATAAAISSNTYPQGATTAYLASGADYPDALAGAPVAALAGAPLLLTSRDCVPASTLAELQRLGTTNIVVLGGTSAVSDAAANLTPCSG